MKNLKLFVVLTAFLIVVGCEKEEEDKPEIVGCEKVEYQGYTYTLNGCTGGGVISYNVDIEQGGHKASFHVTCSNGCLSQVSLK